MVDDRRPYHALGPGRKIKDERLTTFRGEINREIKDYVNRRGAARKNGIKDYRLRIAFWDYT